MGGRTSTLVSPGVTRAQLGPRGISIALRTLHLVSFGILLGGHAFAIDADRLTIALYLTIIGGIGLMVLEMYANGLHWFFLGKGLGVLVKLGILLLVPIFWEYRVFLLLLVVAIASVASHMPARYRHYSFLRRRVLEAGEKLRVAVPDQGVPNRSTGR